MKAQRRTSSMEVLIWKKCPCNWRKPNINSTKLVMCSAVFNYVINSIIVVLKNYCLTPFFLLGSICGLILVTSIIWVFANDFLWKSLSPSIQKENKTFGQWLFAYLGGAALYALNSIFKTISSVLSLQVFDMALKMFVLFLKQKFSEK